VAQSYIGPHSVISGGTVFSSWFVFGGAGSTVSGVNLSVPASESPYAIAFYYYYQPFHKPICIGFPHCI